MKFFLCVVFAISSLIGECQEIISIDSCIRIAIESSEQISVEEIKMKLNDSQQKQVRLSYLPNLNFSGSQGFSLGNSFNVSTSVGQRESRFNSFSLNSSVEIFDGFERKRTIERYDLLNEKNEIAKSDLTTELSILLIEKYAEALLQHELMSFARKQAVSSREKFELVQEQREQNLIGEQNLLEFQTIYLTDEKSYQDTRWRYGSVLIEIGSLIDRSNIAVDTNFVLPARNASIEFNSGYKVNLLEKDLELSENQISIHKTSFYPKMNFYYSFGSNYFHVIGEEDVVYNPVTENFEPNGFTKQLINNRTHFLNFSLNYTLFNRFDTKQKIEQETIRQEMIQMQMDQQQEELNLYYEQLQRTIEKSQNDIDRNEELFLLEEALFKIAEDKFNQGLIPYSEFVDSKNRYFLSMQNVSISKYDYFIQYKLSEVFINAR
jgi:outer membrane protein